MNAEIHEKPQGVKRGRSFHRNCEEMNPEDETGRRKAQEELGNGGEGMGMR